MLRIQHAKEKETADAAHAARASNASRRRYVLPTSQGIRHIYAGGFAMAGRNDQAKPGTHDQDSEEVRDRAGRLGPVASSKLHQAMDRLKAWNCESYAILARQKFNVSLYDLFFSRLQTPTRARAWAIIKMREERGYSYPELGKLWARDHTTIMALYRKWKNGPQKKDG